MGKMSCKVKVIGKPPADYLHFQIFWRGQRFWQRTGLKNTRQNLEMVEATARAISQQIQDKNFNYLQFFPKGNKAHLFRQGPDDDQSSVSSFTVETLLQELDHEAG
jgi:Arm DNA-binding domain